MKLTTTVVAYFFLLIFGCSNADQSFEQEVFQKTTSFIQHYREKGVTPPEIDDFIPEKAQVLIDYAKRYFNEKTLMANSATTSKVSCFKLHIGYYYTFLAIFRIFFLFPDFVPVIFLRIICRLLRT